MNVFNFWKQPKQFVRNEKWMSERTELERYQINYPLNSKVIVKCGNSKPYRIGFIVAHEHKNGGSVLPVVQIGDEKFLCFGIVRHYDDRVIKALDKLSGTEQYNVMAEYHTIDEDE